MELDDVHWRYKFDWFEKGKVVQLGLAY